MKANAITRGAGRQGLRTLLPCALMVLGLLLGGFGCATSNHESAGPAHSEHGKTTALELNHGKKWVVAKPMMAQLQNVEKAVQTFDATPGRNHAVLATEIQENLGRLVTSCTMEGKAHDELHKWLLPFLGLSAEYTAANDPQVQQQKLAQIKAALVTFNTYFE